MKEFNQAVSKIAKSLLSTGIRSYMLNQDIEQFNHWIDMADKYLQEYGHFVSCKMVDNEITVFAGSIEGDIWFKVVLDITFIEAA